MAIADSLPRTAVLVLLVALILITGGLVLYIPVWVCALAAGCLSWRYLIDSGYTGDPPRLWRNLLVLFAVPAVFSQLGLSGDSFQVSVSLLLLGTIFKLLEMRSPRDFVLVVTLAYLLATTGLIFSQNIAMAVWALAATMLLTGALITLQRAGADALRSNLRLAGGLLLQALPLMVVLFVFVPRIAPMWAMPDSGEGATTGVSDEMTPGAITRLSNNNDLALRVRFDGERPDNDQLYWRGLVLDRFDGETWRRARFRREPAASADRDDFPATRQTPRFHYDVILEPTGRNWIYTLHPGWVENSGFRVSERHTWHTERRISNRMRYRGQAFPPTPATDTPLDTTRRLQALQLPDDGDPEARALAERLRGQTDTDAAFAERVMAWLQARPFEYTQTPPPLEGDTIDRFLFDTRAGFCSHYAGAFVYLMRAAGVPARVVVGYQGGEPNPYEDYLMVYQYHAHAWTEVWLEGRGWVRFDPTTAVAPERVEAGMAQWLEQQEDTGGAMSQLRDIAWLNALRLRLDTLDYAWNRWVVSYDNERQLEFLDALTGSRSPRVLTIVLVAAVVPVMAVVTWLVLRGRRPARADPALALYRRFRRRLADAGVAIDDSEGPIDLGRRAAAELPQSAQRIERICDLFAAVYYGVDGGEAAGDRLAALREEVGRFRPRRVSRPPVSP